MASERIPFGSYLIPRDGTDDDRDDVEYTVDRPITVEHTGQAEFTLTVNWPNDLDDVRVTVVLPADIDGSNATIVPAQSGQTIDQHGTRVIFTHPVAATGSTIRYRLDITSETSGESGVVFTFDANELDGPLSWTEEAHFVG